VFVQRVIPANCGLIRVGHWLRLSIKGHATRPKQWLLEKDMDQERPESRLVFRSDRKLAGPRRPLIVAEGTGVVMTPKEALEHQQNQRDHIKDLR
jgi:hypothetical protein